MQSILRSFFFDMARCASANHDRKHVDFALEHCMTTSVVTTFSRSPFSDQRRLGPDLPACLSLSSCSRWMRYFNTKPSPGSRKTIGGGVLTTSTMANSLQNGGGAGLCGKFKFKKMTISP